MKTFSLNYFQKRMFTFLLGVCLLGSCVNFYDIAHGTGNWVGEFALTWLLIFVGYCLFSLAVFSAISILIWRDKNFHHMAERIILIRSSLGWFRCFFGIMVFIFPIWLFQFTVWGIVFQGFFIRLFVWMSSLLVVSVLATKEDNLVSWNVFLMMIILTAGSFSVAVSLKLVSSYPFSLGWSEGNRLWDYSIMFGRNRYDFPLDKDIFVLLEPGRQFVGAVPFLIPGITIKTVRVWIGLLDIFPYILLGLALFRLESKNRLLWWILALWVSLFLKQGPIHSPLIFSAILVALAWRSPYWISVLLILLAGYFTSISRFTWIFAPALWLLMMEFSSLSFNKINKLSRAVWARVAILPCVALFGSIVLPEIIEFFKVNSLADISFSNLMGTSQIAPGVLEKQVFGQSLLWYRLLPNSTYGFGILFGLFIASGPLVIMLYYFIKYRQRSMNVWQVVAIGVPLVAFLGVGLIASTKIGGGGDLHNMDMFLVGLMFSLVIVWLHGAKSWVMESQNDSVWFKSLLLALVFIPALRPLQEMRSYNYDQKTAWLVALTDAPSEKALDMYPSAAVINNSLKIIQSEVDLALLKKGEILFIDQRQLLTFGFIKEVPLVPDYDKKVLIERSLGSSRQYFGQFYADLDNHRFSLIIVQPLNLSQKSSGDQFGEENNAWVKWVAVPLLCYYDIHQTLTDVNVQLLTPNTNDQDCSKKLPY